LRCAFETREVQKTDQARNCDVRLAAPVKGDGGEVVEVILVF
jgi:hypothetical protein